MTPIDATLATYGHFLKGPKFRISCHSTLICMIDRTIMRLAIIIPGAYALLRPKLLGRRFFNLFNAVTKWFYAGQTPYFLHMRDLGFLDSMFGIILVFAVNVFNIILLRNIFEAIPQSFEEAARTDGANDFQVLWKVHIPLS